MHKQLGLSLAIVGAVVLPLMGGTPAQALSRTWVSGTGDDSMPCTRTQPCQTFAVAIGKTDPGGYITCLDPGGFGPVTILQAITIECDEGTGHISASGLSAILVGVPVGSAVTLRGLSLEGIAGAGVHGISFVGQGSLTVQDVVIQDFGGHGINFAPSGGGTSVLNVSNDTLIFNNGGNGILVNPSGGSSAIVVADGIDVDTNANGVVVDGTSGAARLTFRKSVASRNIGFGVQVTSTANRATALVEGSTLTFNANTGFNLTGAQAFGWISTSTVNGNGTGVSSSGTLQSFKDNRIINNGIDGTPMNPVPGVSGFLQ